MARSARIPGRLARLERELPRRCPGCADRPILSGVLFLFNGVLQTAQGVPILRSSLEPCRVCGRGGPRKIIEGVNPGAMLGITVLRDVDPACL